MIGSAFLIFIHALILFVLYLFVFDLTIYLNAKVKKGLSFSEFYSSKTKKV